jgi:hypothetical protein
MATMEKNTVPKYRHLYRTDKNSLYMKDTAMCLSVKPQGSLY